MVTRAEEESLDAPSALDAVGWVGAGRMGSAMARRLLAAEVAVTVTNRTRAKAEQLEDHGARVVDRPVDLAGHRVVFVMVADSADLEAVLVGPGGLLGGNGPVPEVIVDCSTVSAATSEKLRERAESRGCALLAAPVSGNPKVAAAGKLTFAVSGSRSAFDTVEPLLRMIGRGVTYVGEGDLARLVKVCHNVFLGVVTQSLAEVTVLAEKSGIDRAAFLEFLNGSVLGSTFTRYKTPAFVHLDFTPTFTPVLLRKDLELGLAAARETEVPMPLAAQCAQLVASTVGAGYRDEDFAVLLLEAARAAGLDLRPEVAEVDDGLGAAASEDGAP